MTIVVVLAVIIIPTIKKTPVSEENKVEIMQADGNMPAEIKRPATILWTEEIKENNLKQNYPRFLIKKQFVDEKREKEIKEIVGINQENGYFNREDNLVAFTQKIDNIDQLPMKDNFNLEELKNKSLAMVKKINQKEDLEIVWTKIVYKKVNFPWWLKSSQSEAQAVEIRGDYLIEGLKAGTYYGESIQILYNRQGKMLKLNLYLKPETAPLKSEWEIMSLREIKKYRAGVFGVVSDEWVEKVETATVKTAELMWIYNNKSESVGPYYRLGASTTDGGEEKEVDLIIKAYQ